MDIYAPKYGGGRVRCSCHLYIPFRIGPRRRRYIFNIYIYYTQRREREITVYGNEVNKGRTYSAAQCSGVLYCTFYSLCIYCYYIGKINTRRPRAKTLLFYYQWIYYNIWMYIYSITCDIQLWLLQRPRATTYSNSAHSFLSWGTAARSYPYTRSFWTLFEYSACAQVKCVAQWCTHADAI